MLRAVIELTLIFLNVFLFIRGLCYIYVTFLTIDYSNRIM